jgi:uncharacterized protein YndB with AHSA1/START domain
MPGIDENTPTVTRELAATPAKVWEVLSDGWLYPVWVVGAARMREVDDHWPARGARLHHSVGNWPVLLNDVTTVTQSDPEQALRMHARGWPAGAVEVLIELEPTAGGTLVTIREAASDGPARFIPEAVIQAAIVPRNRETLRRLAYVAENR